MMILMALCYYVLGVYAIMVALLPIAPFVMTYYYARGEEGQKMLRGVGGMERISILFDTLFDNGIVWLIASHAMPFLLPVFAYRWSRGWTIFPYYGGLLEE